MYVTTADDEGKDAMRDADTQNTAQMCTGGGRGCSRAAGGGLGSAPRAVAALRLAPLRPARPQGEESPGRFPSRTLSLKDEEGWDYLSLQNPIQWSKEWGPPQPSAAASRRYASGKSTASISLRNNASMSRAAASDRTKRALMIGSSVR